MYTIFLHHRHWCHMSHMICVSCSCRILLLIFDRKPYFCDEPQSAGIVWSEVTFIFNRSDSQFIFLSIDKIQRWEEANEMRKRWFGRKAMVRILTKLFVEKIRFFCQKNKFSRKANAWKVERGQEYSDLAAEPNGEKQAQKILLDRKKKKGSPPKKGRPKGRFPLNRGTI